MISSRQSNPPRTIDRKQVQEVANRCPDANHCIALGKDISMLNQIFQFASFQTAQHAVILNSGASGAAIRIINQSPHEVTVREDDGSTLNMRYEADSVLKVSLPSAADADNLYYEYLIGKEINKYTAFYPCFVETYGCYSSPRGAISSAIPAQLKNRTPLPNINFLRQLQKIDTADDSSPSSADITHFLSTHCDPAATNSYPDISILLQYIGNPVQLWALTSPSTPKTRASVLQTFQFLYQIYFVLAELRDRFTHYDLHLGNIIIYPFSNGQFIDMHYIQRDGSDFTIRTNGIAKMIDYGRSYFKGVSESFYNHLRQTCWETRDKHGHGFNYFNEPNAEDYYVSSHMLNNSHDLTALAVLLNSGTVHVRTKELTNSILRAVPEVAHMAAALKYNNFYGVPVDNCASPNLRSHGAGLCDVTSAEQYLRVFLSTNQPTRSTSAKGKLGDMYIYAGGVKELEWIPVTADRAARRPTPVTSTRSLLPALHQPTPPVSFMRTVHSTQRPVDTAADQMFQMDEDISQAAANPPQPMEISNTPLAQQIVNEPSVKRVRRWPTATKPILIPK